MAKAKKTDKTAAQLERFRLMAVEVGADEHPGALDRSMKRVDPKKKGKAKK